MSSLATELVLNVLRTTFAVYALLVLVHFLLQTLYAHRTHRAFRRHDPSPASGFTPAVDVVVAVYNESLPELQACFESLIVQDYRGELNVYAVDDCSPNRDELVPLYDRCRPVPGWRILLADRNRGKRHAQDLAFRQCRGEILVTIDSDTIVAIDGVRQIVRAFEDSKVGGATGDVGVTNWRTNLLTRLIGMRYWIAFNQERASQGWFRTVLCCSGPLAAYRRSVLDVVWNDYVRQTFRGVACTYGDDRHLTNLVLGEGYDTLFAPSAKAITNAPESMSGYLKQQLRWNKSFYRELLWTLPFLARRSLYMAFDVVVQTALPLLLTLSLASSLLFALLFDPRYALHYAVTITVMALIRCSYAVYRTRRPSFVLFILYGFIHAALLVPLRIRALMTLTDNRWGTRAAT